MSWFRYILFCWTLSLPLGAMAQSPPILITDADMDASSPMDCNVYSPDPMAPANFFDSGVNSANYSDNENENNNDLSGSDFRK